MKQYRIIIKCKAGFLTVVDRVAESPLQCLKTFFPSAIQTIEEKYAENYLTVFALKGSKVLIASKDIYESGEIQKHWSKTNMFQIQKPVTEYSFIK
jgi:hypothetical protein